MLRLADAPVNAREIAGEIRLQHGTLWHEWFHDALVKKGIPFFYELKLDEFMPDGWSGTADWVFWHPRYRAFVLGDLKTARGEAMYWIERKGAKIEHVWQLSAYYYALLKMGLPMVKGFAVMYWPMNDTSDKDVILPSIQECDPLPKEQVLDEMQLRWELSQSYLNEVREGKGLVNDELAPPMAREQKLFWNKATKVFDLKLVPHWTSKFCPYDSQLCDCSDQGTNKIGHYYFSPGDLRSDATTGDLPDEWVYEARKGYEEFDPTEEPSKSEKLKRQKELADG